MSVVSESLPPSYQDSQTVVVTQEHSPPQQTESSILAGATTITKDDIVDDPRIEEDKTSIYKHPLFPLVALLFEKCERATQSSECQTMESCDIDIQSFLQLQEKNKAPLLVDKDTDELMLKAIQVLRIHLLELEKVNDLCKDFCTRYTSCLKGKLQSENLLKVELDPDDDDSADFAPGQPNLLQPTAQNNVVIQSPTVSMATWNQGQIVSGGTVYQMVQTPQGLVAQPIQIQTTALQPQVAGITVPGGATLQSATPGKSRTGGPRPLSLTKKDYNFDDSDDESNGGKRNKRGVLPKYATQIMKSWLFQHIVHPYPTEDEKRQIAQQTNLTLLQVNNWFINARRRILQPMLDSAKPEVPKAKKNKPQSRPSTRFWPECIANIQPQVSRPIQTQASIDSGTAVTHSQPATTPLIVPSFLTMSSDGTLIPLTNAQMPMIPQSISEQQKVHEQSPSPDHRSQYDEGDSPPIKGEIIDQPEDVLNTSVSENNSDACSDSL